MAEKLENGRRTPARNRRVGVLADEIRVALCRDIPRDARRRAERRIRLIAGLLEGGTSRGLEL